MHAQPNDVTRQRDRSGSATDRLHDKMHNALGSALAAVGSARPSAIDTLLQRATAICEAHAREYRGEADALTNEHFDLLREAIAAVRGDA